MLSLEFFYKNRRNHKSGTNFGQTFTKNFQDTTSKKETSRDFSVSSSRNVERSSTFDRKTTNKVRTKKGDQFDEKKWSTSASNENGDDPEGGEEALQFAGLPSSFQQALTAARFVHLPLCKYAVITIHIYNELCSILLLIRFSPERSAPATDVRARPTQQKKSESIPENIPETKTTEEKPKTQKPKTSKKWLWVMFVLVLIVIILAAAVVYNFETSPILKEQPTKNIPGPPSPPPTPPSALTSNSTS